MHHEESEAEYAAFDQIGEDSNMRTKAQRETTRKMRKTLTDKRKRRVNLDANEIVKGDPASLILGKQEEQPARVHRRLEPKPKPINVNTIKYDIELRMDALRPAVEESTRLERAIELLKKIK